MAPRTINGSEELTTLVGEHLGYSDYVEITQDQVNEFADATGDHQWIHVDVERAKSGPFGGPIAHGYLTLSLAPGPAPPGRADDGLLDGRQLRMQQGPVAVAGAGGRQAAHGGHPHRRRGDQGRRP